MPIQAQNHHFPDPESDKLLSLLNLRYVLSPMGQFRLSKQRGKHSDARTSGTMAVILADNAPTWHTSDCGISALCHPGTP